MFNGWNWASSRAVLVTIGQLVFYDVIKEQLLATPYFRDNLTTHFSSSLGAVSPDPDPESLASDQIAFFQGAIATLMTQPLDVLKTRAMNAKPGEFKGPVDLFMFTARQGPMAFFKGFIPAFVRLGPHTIFTFIFFEQLRLNFGYFAEKDKK